MKERQATFIKYIVESDARKQIKANTKVCVVHSRFNLKI